MYHQCFVCFRTGEFPSICFSGPWFCLSAFGIIVSTIDGNVIKHLVQIRCICVRTIRWLLIVCWCCVRPYWTRRILWKCVEYCKEHITIKHASTTRSKIYTYKSNIESRKVGSETNVSKTLTTTYSNWFFQEKESIYDPREYLPIGNCFGWAV